MARMAEQWEPVQLVETDDNRQIPVGAPLTPAYAIRRDVSSAQVDVGDAQLPLRSVTFRIWRDVPVVEQIVLDPQAWALIAQNKAIYQIIGAENVYDTPYTDQVMVLLRVSYCGTIYDPVSLFVLLYPDDTVIDYGTVGMLGYRC